MVILNFYRIGVLITSETVLCSVCCFFCCILLANEIFLLFGCQISASELIFAYPSNSIVAVIKMLFIDVILDFGVLADKFIAVVPVYNDAIPNNDGIDEPPSAKMLSCSRNSSSAVKGGILL